MSYPQRWRDEFMRQAGKYEIPEHHARGLMRVATTLQRLSEAQCNGDFPADNGEPNRQVQCSECLSGWHRSAIRKDGRCIDCHATARAKALAPAGWRVETAGDPRGAVVKLVRESDGLEIGVPS